MRRPLLLLFALSLLAVGVSVPTKADLTPTVNDPEPPRKVLEVGPPVDASLKPLQAALIEAIGSDFVLTGLRVATYDGYPQVLATLRARKAGVFHFQEEVTFNGKGDLPKGWKDVLTCRLTIAEAGQARAVAPFRDAWPLACVGDEVVIPLCFNEVVADCRYALKRDEGTLEQMRQRDDGYAEAWVGRGQPPAFDLRNGASDHLELIAATASSVSHRGLDGWGHYLNAVFEARKPGRFGLRMKLIPEPRWSNKGQCSLQVFPRGQPIRVTVLYFALERHWDRRFSSSHLISSPHVVMRVGDRLVIGCAEYHTDGAEKPKKYLAMEAVVGGLDPEPWSDVPPKK